MEGEVFEAVAERRRKRKIWTIGWKRRRSWFGWRRP